MKNLILLCFSLLLLASCELTEKVYIDEDGAVKYALDIDMSQMKLFAGMDMAKEEDLPMDTIIRLSDLQDADMISTEKMREAIKSNNYEELLKDFKVHIVMNDTENAISLFTHKKNLNELNHYFEEFEKMRIEKSKRTNDSLNDNSEPEFDLPMQSLELVYTGDTFTRSGSYKYNMNPTGDAEDMEMAGMQELFMESIKYNLEYHFPKAVATISDTTAWFSADRKTVFIRKPLKELVANPEAYNFKVTFK